MQFGKPPKSLEAQLDLLNSRGMAIPDREQSKHFLAHLNYYRLAGYWLPFESDHATHAFKPGTSFDKVVNLYVFDRELRLLLLDAIERLEVSARTQWAYNLAHEAGAHAYLDNELVSKQTEHIGALNQILVEYKRSKETFVKHYKNNYCQPDLPPIWSICEIMSLGQLSRWYQNLKPLKLRSTIASAYGLDERVFQSLLHHITYIRNICAHHSRLWNRRMTITMELPRSKPKDLSNNFNHAPGAQRQLYNTLVMLAYILDVISPGHHWKSRLIGLINEHCIDCQAMGFPVGYEKLPIWQV